MSARIQIPKEDIASFCRRHRIRRLALFGSVLPEDFRPDSDIDVLVEFEPDARVGLRFFTMERELSDMLGRKVDLNTLGSLAPISETRCPKQRRCCMTQHDDRVRFRHMLEHAREAVELAGGGNPR